MSRPSTFSLLRGHKDVDARDKPGHDGYLLSAPRHIHIGARMTLFQNPFDPARETALVTGAGNGIGRAVAQALVGEGVRTVFADLSEERVRAAIATSPRPELAVPWVGDL